MALSNRKLTAKDFQTASGAPPNSQLVTDADGVAKWEDRLAYTEKNTSMLVPETTINIESANAPCYDLFALEGFAAGETYIVTWDGVSYECVSYIAQPPDTPSIGNGAIATTNGGNGEPFFCTVYEGKVMLFASESGEHTISIYGATVVVHKIADEYLPPYVKFYTLGDGEQPLTKEELYSIINEFNNGVKVHIRGENAISIGFRYDDFRFAYHSPNPDEGTTMAIYKPNADGLYDLNAAPDEWGYQKLYASSVQLFDALDESDGYYNACRIDQKCVVLMSSTPDSAKKFRITVDDSGTLTATEVT